MLYVLCFMNFKIIIISNIVNLHIVNNMLIIINNIVNFVKMPSMF